MASINRKSAASPLWVRVICRSVRAPASPRWSTTVRGQGRARSWPSPDLAGLRVPLEANKQPSDPVRRRRSRVWQSERDRSLTHCVTGPRIARWMHAPLMGLGGGSRSAIVPHGPSPNDLNLRSEEGTRGADNGGRDILGTPVEPRGEPESDPVVG